MINTIKATINLTNVCLDEVDLGNGVIYRGDDLATTLEIKAPINANAYVLLACITPNGRNLGPFNADNTTSSSTATTYEFLLTKENGYNFAVGRTELIVYYCVVNTNSSISKKAIGSICVDVKKGVSVDDEATFIIGDTTDADAVLTDLNAKMDNLINQVATFSTQLSNKLDKSVTVDSTTSIIFNTGDAGGVTFNGNDKNVYIEVDNDGYEQQVIYGRNTTTFENKGDKIKITSTDGTNTNAIEISSNDATINGVTIADESQVDDVANDLAQEILDRQTAVSNEATARQGADTNLQNQINQLGLDLTAESTARSNTDTSLQSQIDAINAAQNLADIVADLTALNNYDTSVLEANDKVEVLSDSNHDYSATVYNWSGSAWQYIGKYGDSYSKAESDAKYSVTLNASKNYTNNIYTLATNNIAGKDTSTNILAKSSDSGIWVGTDTGHWYYWDGTQYVDGGVYQATETENNSITPEKTTFISDLFDNNFSINDINSNYGCSIENNIISSDTISYNYTFGLNCSNLGIASGTKTLNAGTYYLSFKVKGNVSGGGLAIRFYDTNGNRTNLTTISASYPTDDFGNFVASFTLSDTVSGFGFMFVNGYNGSIAYTIKEVFLSDNQSEFFAYLLDNNIYIDANSIIGSFNISVFNTLLEEYNVVNINRCQIGRWQSNTGAYHPGATNSLCTNYIKTNILKTNKISVNSNSINVIICEYDSSKAFLRGAITNYQGIGQTYTISDDAVFITLSFPNTYTDFSVIGYKIKKELEKSNYETKRILCIGDSLTQGVDYDTHVIAENYPYFLEKDFNVKTYNHGFMGTTASTWYNTRMQYVDFNYTFDIALIMLGTNGGLTDTLDTDVEPYDDYDDYANTDTGCYCKIIEKIMESSPRTQIILIIPPYNYFDETKYNVLLTAVNEIPKIAERYALPIIDLFRCSGMNLKNGNLFRPNDNLHFNAKGYHKMATYIGNQLKSLYSYFYDTDVYNDEYND